MPSSQQQVLQGLSEAVGALDAAALALLGGAPTFLPKSLPGEIPECAELRFMFVVSTLYKLYREIGGDDLKFLNSKIRPSQPEAAGHYDLVHDLRTFDQHDVQSSSTETTRRRDRCRLWFENAVGLQGATRPVGEAAWTKCTQDLLSEAVAYFRALKSFVDGLQGSAGDYVKTEWLLVRTRSIPHGDFDRMASEIAGDIGMESRDIVAFRNQHYPRITTELRAQRFNVDVATFVKRAITARLLEEFPGPLLVAEDLKAVGMKPGRELGRALKEAQRIWIESECRLTKDQVIARLRDVTLPQTPPPS
jgi:hypothetical protein